jgi:enoyl-CoA hydratase/carnithine racemase
MAYTTIQCVKETPVGLLTLNRPTTYNAISVEMMHEIITVLDTWDTDSEVAGVIITGTERFFSTGADLKQARSLSGLAGTQVYLRNWRALNHRIETCGKPVIAAISGYCLTGGLEMALACDLRVAAENAQFGITSCKIGTVAGAGGTQRLPRLIGTARAKELLFSGDFIDAHEAYRIGLIDRLVPQGQEVSVARDMVAIYAQRAPLSLRLTKQAVNTGINLDLESALDLENTLTAAIYQTADRQEGIQAFLDKRPARFTGH